MKLYKLPTAPAGERWHSAKTGLKDYEEVELPKDGRAGMAALFNASELELVGVGLLPPKQLDPLERAELDAARGAAPQRYGDYETPYNARTTLAEIDAGLSARAIRQFDGAELAKVATAVIERMQQLSRTFQGGADGA